MAQWGAEPQWTIADRLRKIRRGTRMNRHDFAARLGIPEPRYGAWESGRNAPSGPDLVALAKRIEMLTGVPAAWTLGLETRNGPRPGWDEGQGLPRLDSDQEPADYRPGDWDALEDVAWHDHEDGWGRAA